MNRRVTTVAALLVLGFVTAVLVAWTCGVHVQNPVVPGLGEAGVSSPVPVRAPDAWWRARAPEGFTRVPTYAFEQRFGVAVSVTFIVADVSATQFERAIRQRSGWPVRALEGSVWVPPAPGPMQYDALVASPLDTWDLPSLALRPLAPGLVVNTLFYAALLAVFWAVLRACPRLARQAYRASRGHCMHCGYPRGESRVCSECGQELPPRGWNA